MLPQIRSEKKHVVIQELFGMDFAISRMLFVRTRHVNVICRSSQRILTGS